MIEVMNDSLKVIDYQLIIYACSEIEFVVAKSDVFCCNIAYLAASYDTEINVHFTL